MAGGAKEREQRPVWSGACGMWAWWWVEILRIMPMTQPSS